MKPVSYAPLMLDLISEKVVDSNFCYHGCYAVDTTSMLSCEQENVLMNRNRVLGVQETDAKR